MQSYVSHMRMRTDDLIKNMIYVDVLSSDFSEYFLDLFSLQSWLSAPRPGEAPAPLSSLPRRLAMY